VCPGLTQDGEPTDRQLLERFARWQDPAAFATLIRRHGPLVLGVCRRVLDHEQDAEDAFQATFLVLVRKGGTIDRPELLGNWLYGVAVRTAQKARVRLARRRHHERQVEPMSSSTDPQADLHWQELRTLLDEALQQLPAKYRAPLVLCYLEGMTNEEAARRLGWPAGSISYRLARGRELLRDRLRQRRQAMPGMTLVALLAQHATPDVPPRLVEATLRVALATARRRPVLPPVLPPLVADAAAPPATPAAPRPEPVKPTTASRARPVLTAVSRTRLWVLLTLLGFTAAAGAAYFAMTGGFGGPSPAALQGSDAPGSCR
jgi:RNA polymerase sigma-70 factor (ECF subfamily)